MKNDDAGRNELGWSALQDLDAARTGLKAISGLAWLSEADAAGTAGLIRRTYEVYPELDLVVSQQALAERIGKFAESEELPLDDRLFLVLLARTIDPRAAGLTEKAVALAIQARAWDIVGELVGGSPLPEDPAGSVVFGDALPSDGLTGVTRLVSHFVRNPSASMWRIGEQLGEEINDIAPVEPGTRVSEDPWQTAALFVQGRNLIKTRNLLAPRGQSALANPAAFVASARRSIDAVLPRAAPLDAPRRPGRERVTGVVRWADVICDLEGGSIPARLLSSDHGRRDEAGATARTVPPRGASPTVLSASSHPDTTRLC